MTGYIIRRVLWIIPVMWAVATITFFLMHAVPGGPFDRERELPPAVMENLNKKYNLDRPLYEQYGLYFWDLLHGDLGNSYRSVNQPVTGLIREGWMTTAQLAAALLLGPTSKGPPTAPRVPPHTTSEIARPRASGRLTSAAMNRESCDPARVASGGHPLFHPLDIGQSGVAGVNVGRAVWHRG